MPFLSKQSARLTLFIFAIAICLWVYSFHIFLLQQSPLVSDALSFYEHLKFYLDQLTRGVYPLWDPLWNAGSSNEFFLRRIGPFNPFFFLIALPYRLGLDFALVFGLFLIFYFFLGMAGFYKLAKEVLRDKPAAWVAFGLLCFSSVGTRVFDSYLMMLLTPLVWFFYFLMVFGRSFQPHAFAGMILCISFLMTTYIPFYFVAVLLSFLILFMVIYPRETKNFILGVWQFSRRYPWLVGLSLLAVFLYCLPGFLFFKSAAQGTFTLPFRHFDAEHSNVLAVKSQVTEYWAIIEDLLYSSFYTRDVRYFDFAAFYVPLAGYIFLFLGLLTRLNRKVLLIFLWMFFFFLLGSPRLVPFYQFMHDHVFFFKYFRNLHFFLWLVILPLLCLFMAEQLKNFISQIPEKKQSRGWPFVFLVIVHTAIAGFLYWQESLNYSTWMVWGGSVLVFTLYFWFGLSRLQLFILLLALTFLQPIEAYYHLRHKALRYSNRSAYDQPSLKFEYTRGSKPPPIKIPTGKQSSLYFATQWYNGLWETIDYSVLMNYSYYKFWIYDRVEPFNEQQEDVRIIQNAWIQGLNVAFVPIDSVPEGNVAASPVALRISEPTKEFEVTQYDVNHIRLKTQFPNRKFIVFNDSYYPGWQALVNGQSVKLYRANIAFKGVWVPAGPQIVEFRYGTSRILGLEIFLLLFSFGYLGYFVWQWRRDHHVSEK